MLLPSNVSIPVLIDSDSRGEAIETAPNAPVYTRHYSSWEMMGSVVRCEIPPPGEDGVESDGLVATVATYLLIPKEAVLVPYRRNDNSLAFFLLDKDSITRSVIDTYTRAAPGQPALHPESLPDFLPDFLLTDVIDRFSEEEEEEDEEAAEGSDLVSASNKVGAVLATMIKRAHLAGLVEGMLIHGVNAGDLSIEGFYERLLCLIDAEGIPASLSAISPPHAVEESDDEEQDGHDEPKAPAAEVV